MSRRLVVLVDGGSGSGKTTFATSLRDLFGVHLVSLEDCYPGWDGLAAASSMVPAMLRPENPGYRSWNWGTNEPAEWYPINPDEGIIIEGCGALTPENRELATLGIWLELDAATRKHRALARDGDLYAPHWDRWAAQEAEHWRLHRPWELADLVIDPTRLSRPSSPG